MRRALVSGAKGFLGRSLTRQLRAQGWNVGEIAGTSWQSTIEPPLFRLGEGNVSAFEEILDAFSPDVVFHLAGRSGNVSVSELYSCNVLLAANLFEAIRRQSRSPVVVLVGSAAEYGPVPAHELPVTEETRCRPVTDYGISKFAQTLTGLARIEAGFPVIIARIFNLVGQGMPDHLALASFAAQLRASRADCSLKVGNLEIERDFIDVDEASKLIAALGSMSEACGRVYNVCSGRAFKLRFLLNELVHLSGRSVRIIEDASRLRPNDMPRFVGSTARLEELGLHPRAPDFAVLLPKLLSEEYLSHGT